MIIKNKYRALLEKTDPHTLADKKRLETCFCLLSAATSINEDCATRLAPFALSESKFVVLFLLQNSPQGLSPKILAEQAGITRATVTSILNGLERQGLIIRRTEIHDRRSIKAQLTHAGFTLIKSIFTEHTQWISSLFADFTTNELDQLTNLLEKLWNTLQKGNRLS